MSARQIQLEFSLGSRIREVAFRREGHFCMIDRLLFLLLFRETPIFALISARE
jgi:hypothetical protein